MEARGQEEAGAIQAGIGGLGAEEQLLGQDLAILVGLDGGEHHPQQHRDQQAPLGRLAVPVLQGMVRPGDRGAGGEQDHRVDQREVPGIQGLDALGRPDGPGGADFVDGGMGAGPVEQGHLEEDPEPGHEEHHFGGDEQDHAVAQADGHHRRMVADLGFLDHVRPPAEHGVEDAEEAQHQHHPVPLRQTEEALQAHDQAKGENGGRNRTDQRPRARLDEVIIVFDSVAGHDLLSTFRP